MSETPPDQPCLKCKNPTKKIYLCGLCFDCSVGDESRRAPLTGQGGNSHPEIHIQGSLPPKAEAALVGILKEAYPRQSPNPDDPQACAERPAFHPETPTRRPLILPDHLVADTITCGHRVCGKTIPIADLESPKHRWTKHPELGWLCWRCTGVHEAGMRLPEGCFRCDPRTAEIKPGILLKTSGYDPENPQDFKDPYLGSEGEARWMAEGSHRILAGLQDPQDSDEGLTEDDPSIEHPVLCFQRDIECARCKGAGKIPNLAPGDNFVDCPDCEGQGKRVSFESVSESQLDEGVALGIELAQLRHARKLAYEATLKILGILNLAHSLASNTPHYQAEAAAKNIKEAIKITGDLQAELRKAGA